jgi:hypothetical protein
VARPAGAWIVEDSGTVRWQPAVDVTRMAVLGQLTAAAALLLLVASRRSRERGG